MYLKFSTSHVMVTFTADGVFGATKCSEVIKLVETALHEALRVCLEESQIFLLVVLVQKGRIHGDMHGKNPRHAKKWSPDGLHQAHNQYPENHVAISVRLIFISRAK